MTDPAAPAAAEASEADVAAEPGADLAGSPAACDHRIHLGHMHVHDVDCGHEAVVHGDHLDYLHDGHRHACHGGHYDEH